MDFDNLENLFYKTDISNSSIATPLNYCVMLSVKVLNTVFNASFLIIAIGIFPMIVNILFL